MNKIIKSKEKKTLWEQFKNLIGKQNMEVNVIEIKKNYVLIVISVYICSWLCVIWIHIAWTVLLE